MNFEKFDSTCFNDEDMQMHEVAEIILDVYDGESVSQFLEDMQLICKGDEEKKYKAVAAFGYYYIASKFDQLLVPMVKQSWDDMVKFYH